MKKKIVVLALAAVLVLGCVIGGTLAWLKDETKTVTNVFTYGDINIDLKETGATDDGAGGLINDDFKIIPGNELTKDPTVTVKANSEACYLFVKVAEDDWNSAVLTYAIADGWTLVDGTSDVYYREVASSDEDQDFAVIKGNVVTVPETVTKGDVEALAAAGTQPKLTITAYAVQKDNVDDVATAWGYVTNP